MLKGILIFFHKRKINRALANESLYSFYFDVTTGILKHDIIGNNGVNYTKSLALSSPCSFDMYMYQLAKLSNGRIENSLGIKEMSSKSLIKAFEKGHRIIEETVFFENTNQYQRITYNLVRSKRKGHIIAYVFGQDVTSIESEKIVKVMSTKKYLEEVDSILTSAEVGIWKIFDFDGEEPRMTATRAMKTLLGLDPKKEIPEEVIYNQWYDNVPEESLKAVHNVLSQMKYEGKGEATYKWYHPTNGMIYVRCGGTAEYIKGKGYLLSGYHYDVTEIVNRDMEQKRLLEESVSEFKKQKLLLEATLEAYQKADHERRTDFLTGLKNRQDMFDVIEQSISKKRTPITAMFMVDIDYFKTLNDNYGHLMGDNCLKNISSILKEYGLQNSINFYRYGGEEILGISFNQDKDANTMANEIVQLVYDMNIQRDDIPAKRVTISLGYTDDNSRYEHMIAYSDKALYQAKMLGRNRAVKYLDDSTKKIA